MRKNDDLEFRKYLTQEHSEAVIKRWAGDLKILRFCRAYGGPSNDGDHFLARLTYSNEPDLHSLMAQIGITLNRLGPDEPESIIGRPDLREVRSKVKHLSHLEQPGHCKIFSVNSYVWVDQDQISISIAEGYVVTEETFEATKKVDIILLSQSARAVEPPQDDIYCVCQKFYPEFFKN